MPFSLRICGAELICGGVIVIAVFGGAEWVGGVIGGVLGTIGTDKGDGVTPMEIGNGTGKGKGDGEVFV